VLPITNEKMCLPCNAIKLYPAVLIRSRVEKARARALLLLQGQDATISVSTADRSGYQSGTGDVDSALYPPLVEKLYDADAAARGSHHHGLRRASRCPCSAHAHWTPYADDDAAVGLVEGVDVVPEMDFARAIAQYGFSVSKP